MRGKVADDVSLRRNHYSVIDLDASHEPFAPPVRREPTWLNFTAKQCAMERVGMPKLTVTRAFKLFFW